MKRNVMFVAMILASTVFSCSQRDPNADQIIRETMAHRSEVDYFFRSDPESPFNHDTSVRYEGIKWFPPEPEFSFRSKLFRYEHAETVLVYGTKGDERKQLKYGYFLLDYDGKNHPLNTYREVSPDPSHTTESRNRLSVWFTDETTGKETYEVGRYVEVGEESGDSNHVYTVNLNNAYNPYCAYSALYSCAIPRKEDHLSFSVRAGEMKYHH